MTRLVGALRWMTIEPQRGIWFEGCSAVHTLGMRVPLDIMLLDRGGTIVDLRAGVRPNRLIVTHHAARHILEMGAGFIERSALEIGDRLTLDCDTTAGS